MTANLLMSCRIAVVASGVFLALTLGAGSAMAQLPFDETGWLVAPGIGLALDGDGDPSLTITGAVARRVTETIGAEGELGHVFDLRLAPGDANVDSSVTTLHGSLPYMFDTGFTAIPYIIGGVGIAKFSHEVTGPPASIDRSEIGFNIGGGFTYPLTDRAWARGDFWFFKHIDEVPSVWRFGGGSHSELATNRRSVFPANVRAIPEVLHALGAGMTVHKASVFSVASGLMPACTSRSSGGSSSGGVDRLRLAPPSAPPRCATHGCYRATLKQPAIEGEHSSGNIVIQFGGQ